MSRLELVLLASGGATRTHHSTIPPTLVQRGSDVGPIRPIQVEMPVSVPWGASRIRGD